MRLKLTLIAAMIAALPGVAAAQTTDTPTRADKRQQAQEKRIDKQTQSGQLTEAEAKRLEKGQERVTKMEEKAAADGTVTKKEKVRIERAQDRQSKRTYKQSHDRQSTQ
jgi:hypothetical protein